MNEDDKTPAAKGYLTANFKGGNMEIYSFILSAAKRLNWSWNQVMVYLMKYGMDGFKKKWGLTDD